MSDAQTVDSENVFATPNPVNIEINIDEDQFSYSDQDAYIVAKAIHQCLRLYMEHKGNLGKMEIKTEEYELDMGSGLRLTLYGQTVE